MKKRYKEGSIASNIQKKAYKEGYSDGLAAKVVDVVKQDISATGWPCRTVIEDGVTVKVYGPDKKNE